MKVRIYTGDDTYLLHSNGQVERPGLVKPSEAWRIVGAVEHNNFGRAVRRYTLAEILSDPDSIPWRYKNGKQRVHLCDFDHGGYRVWMSPAHSVVGD